jgi:hypothetical protein
MYNSMAEYPHWFVVTCWVFATAVGLWIAVKLIKAALWMALFFVLFVAASTAVWYLLR